jgi:hypothetical protein
MHVNVSKMLTMRVSVDKENKLDYSKKTYSFLGISRNPERFDRTFGKQN